MFELYSRQSRFFLLPGKCLLLDEFTVVSRNCSVSPFERASCLHPFLNVAYFSYVKRSSPVLNVRQVNTASIGRLHRTSWMEFIGFSLILSSLLIGPAIIGGVGTVLVMQAGGLIVVFDRTKKRRSEDGVVRRFQARYRLN